MNGLRLVVFDMAGTTVTDTGGVVNRHLRDALAAAGFSAGVDAVNAVMGIPKPEAIRTLTGAAPQTVASIHADFVARILRHYREDPSVAAVPGARECFDRLRAAGIRVALDTGFSRDIVDAIVERLGWGDAVDATIASDEVARGRPFPDLIDALRARLGIDDPAGVAKVGDTPSDLEEGFAAGCGWVIGVTEGSHTRAELEAHRHTHLIGSVADLPALLGL